MNGEIPETDEGRDGVADCRRNGRPLQSPVEDEERDIVEHHVDNAADERGEHREPRLPCRNEEDVEDQPRHRQRCGDKERHGVDGAERIERIVRTEEVENRAQEDEAADSDCRAEDNADEDEQGEVLARMAAFSLSKLRCDERAPARAEHRREDDRERDERHDDVDRRQPVRPDGVRNKETVHDEVHIHKELRDDHRHGECEQCTVGNGL